MDLHIARSEDVRLLENLERGGGDPEGVRRISDPFETSRSARGGLELPDLAEAEEHMARMRRAVLSKLDAADLRDETPLLRDGFVFRTALAHEHQHEYQHNETVLSHESNRGRLPDAEVRAPAGWTRQDDP